MALSLCVARLALIRILGHISRVPLALLSGLTGKLLRLTAVCTGLSVEACASIDISVVSTMCLITPLASVDVVSLVFDLPSGVRLGVST